MFDYKKLEGQLLAIEREGRDDFEKAERIAVMTAIFTSKLGPILKELLCLGDYMQVERAVVDNEVKVDPAGLGSVMALRKMVDAIRFASIAHADPEKCKQYFNLDADSLVGKKLQYTDRFVEMDNFIKMLSGNYGENNVNLYLLTFVLQIVARNGYIANDLVKSLNLRKDSKGNVTDVCVRVANQVYVIKIAAGSLSVVERVVEVPDGFMKAQAGEVGYYDPLILYMHIAQKMNIGIFEPEFLQALRIDPDRLETYMRVLQYLNILTLRQGVEVGSSVFNKGFLAEVLDSLDIVPVEALIGGMYASAYAGLAAAGYEGKTPQTVSMRSSKDPNFVYDLLSIYEAMVTRNLKLREIYRALIEEKGKAEFRDWEKNRPLIKLLLALRVNLTNPYPSQGIVNNTIFSVLYESMTSEEFKELFNHFSDDSDKSSSQFAFIYLPKLMLHMVLGTERPDEGSYEALAKLHQFKILAPRVRACLLLVQEIIRVINEGEYRTVCFGTVPSLNLGQFANLIKPENLDLIAEFVNANYRNKSLMTGLVVAGIRGSEVDFMFIVTNGKLPPVKAPPSEQPAASRSAVSERQPSSSSTTVSVPNYREPGAAAAANAGAVVPAVAARPAQVQPGSDIARQSGLPQHLADEYNTLIARVQNLENFCQCHPDVPYKVLPYKSELDSVKWWLDERVQQIQGKLYRKVGYEPDRPELGDPYRMGELFVRLDRCEMLHSDHQRKRFR